MKASLHTTCLLVLAGLASYSNAAISISFSQGATLDEIVYNISGSDVWNGGTVNDRRDIETRLPRVDNTSNPDWAYTDSLPWDSVAPFKTDIGIVTLNAGSTFEMLVDGIAIFYTGSSSSFRIDGDSTGDFTFRTPDLGIQTSRWEYPDLTGGETISWRGNGSFNVTGGLTTNMNLGTQSYTDSGGITFQTNVVAVPEPSSSAQLGLGILGLLLRRRR